MINASNIISKFNVDFSEDFFSVGQKIKLLETHPDFLTFSAKMHNRQISTEMLYTPTPWLTLLLVLGKSHVNQKSC